MHTASVALFMIGAITTYTGKNNPLPGVEAITDRGPILELIVRCKEGTGIITYSKMEKLYCGPTMRCDRDMQTVIKRTCR